MTNLAITIIIFTLLVTQKILLLNEESLILLCFIIFVKLSTDMLGDSIKKSSKVQSNEIKINLIESLKKLLAVIQSFTLLSSNSRRFLKKIIFIKSYYRTIISSLSSYIPIYNKFHLTAFYTKKLAFLDKTEEQTIKLLTTVIIRQLNLIIKTKYFYTNYIKFNQLLSTTNISVRERIQLIKSKKI
uniref:ATP synthase B chain n=1 Tax=Porolithon onkodes TaxID=231751 RepID=A0A2Z2KSP7_9FLOR|nr:ATP synthase B chain precursor [Porolithon onkodes]ASB29829.1 ATP synthase B chain precursor [Porolithon onkodes]